MIYLAIALGGAVGSVLRYALGRTIQTGADTRFPVGTFVVNVAGCVIIGLLARYFRSDETRPVLQATLMIGFCGGFTTFSAFSHETINLITGGEWVKATAYVAMSVAACLAGTAIALAGPKPG
jgi:fluoride exporter